MSPRARPPKCVWCVYSKSSEVEKRKKNHLSWMVKKEEKPYYPCGALKRQKINLLLLLVGRDSELELTTSQKQ